MNDHDPVGPRLDPGGGNPPAPPADTANASGPPAATRVGLALAMAAVAVATGGALLAAAVVWGAAEAAVGVGAAYLVYTALADQKNNLAGLLAVRLIGTWRSSPPADAGPGQPRPD